MQPQNLLNLHNLSIFVNGFKLIESLDLKLRAGDKLGLIGSEGNGKSLLLKVMAGISFNEEIKIEGKREVKTKIGYVPQDFSEKEMSLFPGEYLTGSNWEKMNEWGRWNNIFQQLDLDNNWLNRETELRQLSGGEKVKLKLARTLFDQPELLLLDEPTNYLDIQTLRWLEKFCRNFTGGLVVISHDEVFLERVANRILHLERLAKRQKNVWRLENINFADYQVMKERVFKIDTVESARQRRKHDEQMKKLLEIKHKVMMDQIRIIDSNSRRLLNKKMKTLVSQQKKLENKDLLTKPDKEKNIQFEMIPINANPQKIWLRWNNMTMDLGVKKIVVKNLELRGAEKIFIIGANGVGKTLMLKKIKNYLIEKGNKVGYVPQNYSEILPFTISVSDWLATDEYSSDIKTALGWLNFGREEMDRPIGKLSCGQQMKVMLLALKNQLPQLILLDEPMSNLSLFSRQELGQAINNFNGPMIAVSHDRKFIEEVADRVYLLKDNCLVEDNPWKNDEVWL